MKEKTKKVINDIHISGIINRMTKLDDLVNIHGVDGLKKRIGDRMIESYIKDKELDIFTIDKNKLLKTYEKDISLMDSINEVKEHIDDVNYQLLDLENEKKKEIKLIEGKYFDVIEYIEISKNKLTEKYNTLLEEKLLNKSL